MKAESVFCNLLDATVESQGFGKSPNFVEVYLRPKIPCWFVPKMFNDSYNNNFVLLLLPAIKCQGALNLKGYEMKTLSTKESKRTT